MSQLGNVQVLEHGPGVLGYELYTKILAGFREGNSERDNYTHLSRPAE